MLQVLNLFHGPENLEQEAYPPDVLFVDPH